VRHVLQDLDAAADGTEAAFSDLFGCAPAVDWFSFD
jgi:hypothetical protein